MTSEYKLFFQQKIMNSGEIVDCHCAGMSEECKKLLVVHIEAYADKRVEEEREACALAACLGCNKSEEFLPADKHGLHYSVLQREVYGCRALNIRARGEVKPLSAGEVIKNECFQRAVEHGAEMRVLDAIRSLDVTTVLAKEAGSEKKI